MYTFPASIIGDTADRRIARHLLELAVRSQTRQALLATVTHQEIASAIGLTRETVSRVLYKFRAKGLIGLSRNSITLDDPLGLYMIAWPEDTYSQ